MQDKIETQLREAVCEDLGGLNSNGSDLGTVADFSPWWWALHNTAFFNRLKKKISCILRGIWCYPPWKGRWNNYQDPIVSCTNILFLDIILCVLCKLLVKYSHNFWKNPTIGVGTLKLVGSLNKRWMTKFNQLNPLLLPLLQWRTLWMSKASKNTSQAYCTCILFHHWNTCLLNFAPI
jgi:hypothetical protein